MANVWNCIQLREVKSGTFGGGSPLAVGDWRTEPRKICSPVQRYDAQKFVPLLAEIMIVALLARILDENVRFFERE